ncbi:MAG: hypothetical protein HY718_15240 [Planctomycetes bacterium]|nr:hypothetical protein [Planctomycetota bacterium]
MRRFILILVLTAALRPAEAPAANTWCSTNFPNAVFCEDFDRYCVDPPPEPQACSADSTKDGGTFNSRWIPYGPCSSGIGLDDTWATSPPWGAKTNTQENSTLGIAKRSMTDSIKNHFGGSCFAVMATDLNPLVLELAMQAHRPRYDNSYLSLGAGFAAAPTDYAWSNFCGCSAPDPRYPVICAQDSPAANCPPSGAAPHVPCIAVGFVAYLDPDPCHCGESHLGSFNDHLSFYDGQKWYRLREGLLPGSGDFRLRNKEHRIRVTVKLTTLKVELTTPETGEYSWCELPRDYLGPFSSLNAGYTVPCQLKTGVWECRGDPYDPVCGVGPPGGSVPYYDNLVLHGGVCYEPSPGACCFPDTACTSAYGGDCATLGGEPAGAGTNCATTACCPPLRPDHDMDGDADLEDFGWFQTCLSVAAYLPPPTLPCTCADLDGDGDVDVDDFNVFAGCMLGPGVPANPNCDG